MTERIVAAGIEPDLYLVTSFVTVANGLRRLFRESATRVRALLDIGRLTRGRI